ncbi:hypothetical protein BDZ45DRAFT_691356 [Acephala macrosclerotiorum]|nr:hypothetical protein BDZ45DRAFT_691356 [Acephala macrosclerotiorum]
MARLWFVGSWWTFPSTTSFQHVLTRRGSENNLPEFFEAELRLKIGDGGVFQPGSLQATYKISSTALSDQLPTPACRNQIQIQIQVQIVAFLVSERNPKLTCKPLLQTMAVLSP